MQFSPESLHERFFRRFDGRTIIVHAGFPEGYLAELLRQPGGGGHFRVDVRIPPARPFSPMDWVVHHHVLPLGLPQPLLMKVGHRQIHLRHLIHHIRQEIPGPGHPAEILWMLDSIQERYHALLKNDRGEFCMERGMDIQDNSVDYSLHDGD